MTKFDEDTALVERERGLYEGRISGDWSIVRGANGGHLAAIVLRGIRAALADDDRHAKTLTVHFARVPSNDRVDLDVTIERSGRTMSNVSARMTQEGKLIALAIAAFSTQRTGPDFTDVAMPDVPSPEEIEVVPDRKDFPFGRQFDFRRALGPDFGERGDRAELGVWVRMREPQLLDEIGAVQLMDAFAPAVFAKLGQGGGGAGVPTVEMTFHLRETLPLSHARPDDWYLGIFRTDTSREGFLEEDGWLWTASGVLVAQSRQLALLLAP